MTKFEKIIKSAAKAGRDERVRKKAAKVFGGKLNRIKKAFLSKILTMGSARLGMKLNKESVKLLLNGQASKINADDAMTIGMLIKQFAEPSLNVKLFVEECAEGIYDKKS